MSINRGLPTDGTQDRKPWVKCHACRELRPCYRGPLIGNAPHPRGAFELYAWWCSDCLRLLVNEALVEDGA